MGNCEILPSEFDLQNKYQASRDTIRKALLLLSQNGYIQKSQGKGSIVLDINRFNFPVSGLTSFKEIASDIKGKVETIVHTCECIEPDEEIKKLLMLTTALLGGCANKTDSTTSFLIRIF